MPSNPKFGWRNSVDGHGLTNFVYELKVPGSRRGRKSTRDTTITPRYSYVDFLFPRMGTPEAIEDNFDWGFDEVSPTSASGFSKVAWLPEPRLNTVFL